ncbi:GTPase Era [Enterobacteriaceae endosymbiont of Donacia cincticornis]|uniref:GTPase Era n=1 Tax=Enterobacteriaceae endosymbiont of Donacia cincticornis TaxID=2675773 RepID=UPI0014573490|nr:GTPase Era [Enterobacteriaceae endosymbiont of Donacia cincticornis]
MKIISSYYGSVLLIGRTNAGKSTLLNFLVKKKISIVSHKRNTTNNNIIGVYNNDIYQIEFIDTPGNIFYKNKILKLLKNNKYDFILFILDKNKWNYIEDNFTKILSKINIPIILIINKIDQIKNKNILLPYINFLKKKINIFHLFIISAKYKLYTNDIYRIIYNNLPKKKHFYSKNYITNQTDQVIIKEIIRENIIKFIHKEIPYLVKIKVIFSKILLNKINILFLVKKINHKKIIIGKNSHNIKLIKNRSEKNIEKFFKKKIKLNIWIKIK